MITPPDLALPKRSKRSVTQVLSLSQSDEVRTPVQLLNLNVTQKICGAKGN